MKLAEQMAALSLANDPTIHEYGATVMRIKESAKKGYLTIYMKEIKAHENVAILLEKEGFIVLENRAGGVTIRW